MNLGQILKYLLLIATVLAAISLYLFIQRLSNKPAGDTAGGLVVREFLARPNAESTANNRAYRAYQATMDSLQRALGSVSMESDQVRARIRSAEMGSGGQSGTGSVQQLQSKLQELESQKDQLEDRLANLKRPLDNQEAPELKRGNIAYEIPDSMRIREVSRVAVSISPEGVPVVALRKTVAQNAALPQQAVDTTTVETEAVKVGQKMTASLSAPGNMLEEHFKIEQIGASEQILFDGNDFTASWQWDVIPLKKGAYPLNLKVDAIVVDGLAEYQVNIPVFTKRVMVVSEGNPLPYLLLVVLGVGTILVGFFLRKKQRTASSTSPGQLSSEHRKQAQTAIANGQTERAITTILEHGTQLPDQLEHQLTVHLSEIKETQRQHAMGIIDHAEQNKVNNRINLALLQIIKDLEKNSPAEA